MISAGQEPSPPSPRFCGLPLSKENNVMRIGNRVSREKVLPLFSSLFLVCGAMTCLRWTGDSPSMTDSGSRI
jgi:hypothetical protein